MLDCVIVRTYGMRGRRAGDKAAGVAAKQQRARQHWAEQQHLQCNFTSSCAQQCSGVPAEAVDAE